MKLKRKNQWETEESLIKEVIENFDFDKCQKTMDFLNWNWVSVGIPTVNHLVDSAKKRLRDCISYCKECKELGAEKPYMVSSGGLKASAIKNRYGHIIWLSLEFVLTDWTIEYDLKE
jgi:hypothetical protein